MNVRILALDRALRPLLFSAALALTLGLLSAGPEVAGARQSNLLPMWIATKGDRSVFVVPTVHYVPPDIYPLPQGINKALAQAEVVVLEVDTENLPDGETLKKELSFKPNDNLANHVAAETLTTLLSTFEQLGIPKERVVAAKPYLIMATLSKVELERSGLSFGQGLDEHFLKEARAAAKPVVFLESALDQIRPYDALTNDEINAMLKLRLQRFTANALARDVAEIVAAWKRGDQSTIERISTRHSAHDPLLRSVSAKTIYSRNVGMNAGVIRTSTRHRRVFVAIGAGHVYGATGVLAHLRASGFRVEQAKQ